MQLKQLLLFVLCFCFFQSFSQEETIDDVDSWEGIMDGITPDSSKLVKRISWDFAAMDFGMSSYLSEGTGLDMPDAISYMDQRYWRSGNFILHFVDFKLGLHGTGKVQKLFFRSGLWLNQHYYGFQDDFQLLENQATFEEAISYAEKDVRKHRLLANYATIPLALEYNSNPGEPLKNFYISAGYNLNILFAANHKIKYDDKEKIKAKDSFNLNNNLGMLDIRLGYGPVRFYFQYGLDALFLDNKGPNLTPINFGFMTSG